MFTHQYISYTKVHHKPFLENKIMCSQCNFKIKYTESHINEVLFFTLFISIIVVKKK